MSATYTEAALCYPESEKQVIGGLLSKYEEAGKYVTQLCAEDFSIDVYREIFEQLCAILKSGQPFDYALLINRCSAIECKQEIVNCVDCFVSPSTLPEHIKALKTATKRRKIKQAIM